MMKFKKELVNAKILLEVKNGFYIVNQFVNIFILDILVLFFIHILKSIKDSLNSLIKDYQNYKMKMKVLFKSNKK